MKNKKKVLQYLKKYSVITLGCIIFSLGTSLFLDAHDIAPGGVTGIAIIINHLIELALGREIQITGILIIVINVPMFILGIIFLGKQFIIPSVFATVLSSLLMLLWSNTLLPYMPNIMPDTNGDTLLLSALIGGAMFGVGLGLIFRMGATTGGTDILVKILRKKFRYLRTGIISMAIDMIIVACSVAAFQNFILACYTVITIIVYVVLFDWFLYGGNTAKLVYVITTAEHAETMCDKILNELDAGATLLDANGAYAKLHKKAQQADETDLASVNPYDRQIIMCAIKGFLYPKLHDVVKEADPNAFMIVSSAREIYGEGYKNHNDDEL